MKKTLKSGATLDITRSPFVVGHKLFKTIAKELKGVDVKLGLKEGQTLGNLTNFEVSDEAINTVKDLFCTILSSQEVEDILWECMIKATYNGQKINRELFDNDQAAEDYLEISKEVMSVNLIPFQKSLASLFPNMQILKPIESPR